MWENRARLVRLNLQRGDEPRAGARDAVRADVVLRERPERGFLRDEDRLLTPLAEEAAGLLLGLGERQVNDVVRAAGEVARPLLGPDHVVRRRDELCERTGALRVVAEGAKRLHYGQSAATLPSVLGPRLDAWLRSRSSSRTGSSRASTRSRRRSACARAAGRRTSPWSSSTRAAASRHACGTTWSSSTHALPRVTRCASSVESTATAT